MGWDPESLASNITELQALSKQWMEAMNASEDVPALRDSGQKGWMYLLEVANSVRQAEDEGCPKQARVPNVILTESLDEAAASELVRSKSAPANVTRREVAIRKVANKIHHANRVMRHAKIDESGSHRLVMYGQMSPASPTHWFIEFGLADFVAGAKVVQADYSQLLRPR